jgi:signal transduction histidine kinase
MHGVIKIRTSISTGRDGQRHIRITLADNGKGVDPKSRARIFEPPYTTKDAIGTGLGLWVTKLIVEKHRGAIRYRSQLNGLRTGSTFSVTLPIGDTE